MSIFNFPEENMARPRLRLRSQRGMVQLAHFAMFFGVGLLAIAMPSLLASRAVGAPPPPPKSPPPPQKAQVAPPAPQPAPPPPAQPAPPPPAQPAPPPPPQGQTPPPATPEQLGRAIFFDDNLSN